MLMRTRNFLLVITLLFLNACATHYDVVKANREEYRIDSRLPADSSIIQTYLPYKTALDAEMNRVIGHAAVDLTKNNSVPESLLGNFFADAVASQAKRIVADIDFIFPTTKGGLRNDIVKGDVTVSKIFELMPFENQLVLVTLSGKDTYTLLKYIAATNGQPVNGLRMKIVNKLPENILINGKTFDPDKTYRILTSDYIANGGDDSKGFTAPVSRRNIGLLIRDALLKEVNELEAAGKKINPKIDGRITAD